MEFKIETERLILRHWRESDAADLYKYASDSRVSRLALWPAHTSQEMSQMVIREVFKPNSDSYAIVLRNTGEVIGCVGLVPDGQENYAVEPGEREAGYWIGFPHWGNGYTPEALSAITEYYSLEKGIGSFLVTLDATNAASRRVAEKCGFNHVADYLHDGIPSQAFRLRK